MKKPSIVSLCTTLLASSLAFSSATATAAEPSSIIYPNQAVRIVVPYPAGGTVDTLARVIGQHMSDTWKQPVIVENRPGGGANIGAELVTRAKPDGYTLLMSPPAPYAINQSLFKSIPYDPDDLAPITVISKIPNVITARADLPVDTLPQLIEYLKKNPGKITYGSQGNGSTSHLTAELFSTLVDADMIHVPYKGEGPALIDMLGGRIDLFFGNISAVLKFREENKVKFLGVANAERTPFAPDVPTMSEATGIDGFEASAWFALSAPRGTPQEVIEKIHAAVLDALDTEAVKNTLKNQGAEPVGSSPAEMAEFVAAERERWRSVIENAGVTVD